MDQSVKYAMWNLHYVRENSLAEADRVRKLEDVNFVWLERCADEVLALNQAIEALGEIFTELESRWKGKTISKRRKPKDKPLLTVPPQRPQRRKDCN